jgi:hypothetical protein
METNNDQVDSEVPDLPQVEEGAEDTTDWKATALKLQGMAKRFKTKADKLTAQQSQPKSETTQQKTEANQTKSFDYAQKAYLKASGIQSEEFDFVKEVMDATGKSDIDAVINSKYFQAELKERRDLKTTEDATPTGTKRAGNQTRNDVDYWISKGELPKDNPALARKVVNARIATDNSKSQFTDNPVVRG